MNLGLAETEMIRCPFIHEVKQNFDRVFADLEHRDGPRMVSAAEVEWNPGPVPWVQINRILNQRRTASRTAASDPAAC